MRGVKHTWRNGFWGGQSHTTVHFDTPHLSYACSCGETAGFIPNLRELDDGGG